MINITKKSFFIIGYIILAVIVLGLGYVTLKSSKTVNRKYLMSNDYIIVTKIKDNSTNETISSSYTINELISILNGEVNKSTVKDYFSNQSFKLLSDKNEVMVFAREGKHIPNYYYIGVTEEGLLALYRCNENGILVIEDEEKDIIEKDIQSIPESEREAFINNKYEFNNKKEAIEQLMHMAW